MMKKRRFGHVETPIPSDDVRYLHALSDDLRGLRAAKVFIDPNLKGHYLLPAIFPNFTLLTIGSFIYGLIASGLYGWIVAITFVFFYNLWPGLAAALFGPRVVVNRR